jgi:hypothetical protein
MANMQSMSKNDSTVLSQIFDPEAAQTAEILIDASRPEDPHVQDPSILSGLKAKVKEIILSVEAAMKQPNDIQGREEVLAKACRDIDALVEQYPMYASLRNDRAQLLRLQNPDNLLVLPVTRRISGEVVQMVQTMVVDLDTAIKLLAPASVNVPISRAQCRTLSQAYTQRGALYHTAAKTLSKSPDSAIVIQRFKSWTQFDFEEAASKDFFMGGRYGNEIGKALAVHINPTAKLCGQMVQEAMRREYAPSLQP